MRRRVLQVVASLDGGAASHMATLLRHLDHERYESAAAYGPGAGTVRPEDLAAAGAALLPTEPFGLGGARAVPGLRHILRDDWDLVHFHGTRAAVAGRAALLGMARRPRVVYTIHGYHILHYRSAVQRRAAVWLERGLARVTDAIVCVSPADADAVRAIRAAPSDRVRVIPNGVDLDAFRDAPGRAQARASLDLPADAAVVVMVARLHPPKDHATLLRAFADVRASDPRAVLVLVGDGPDRGAIEAEAARLPPGSVRFLGRRGDVPTILRASDVAALATGWEGMPIALVEAMAAGVPVVATDVPGVRAALGDPPAGLLVPPRDATALADAIRAAAAPGERRERAIEAGLRRARELDARLTTREIERVYEQVMAR